MFLVRGKPLYRLVPHSDGCLAVMWKITVIFHAMEGPGLSTVWNRIKVLYVPCVGVCSEHAQNKK